MPDRYTHDRIERIAERALQEAGVLGVVPTPLDALHPVAGIAAVERMPALPERVRSRPGRDLLGALWFEERTIFLDEAQSAPRRRFTHAHELMHALCPWHEAVLREDTSAELFRATVDQVEAEANLGAAMLLFQGRRFAQRHARERPSIRTPLRLAREYGASAHAAIHHYVVTHAKPLALLVVGRFPRKDGSLPVWRSVESRRFMQRFDRAADAAPGGIAPRTPLRELIEAARTSSDPPHATLPWPDQRGRIRRVEAHAHDNRHAFLVLVAPAA